MVTEDLRNEGLCTSILHLAFGGEVKAGGFNEKPHAVRNLYPSFYIRSDLAPSIISAVSTGPSDHLTQRKDFIATMQQLEVLQPDHANTQ